MSDNRSAILVIVGGWLAVFAAVMIFRPLMPMHETRYFTVAWEMLVQHHWLLPTLNFEAYAQKPPMLFWMIRAGWEIFGVGLLGPRVLIFLAIGALFYQIARLARDLWPESPEMPARAVLLFTALPMMLTYASTVMFDSLMALCVVSAMIAIWQAGQNKRYAFIWFGVAMGVGILIKGPVMLVYALPAALLAPVWLTNNHWRRWYAGIVLAVVIGAAMGLAWAIPAAIQGGADYTHKIFVTQSAGRMVNAFDHVEPFWYYIPVLAGFLLPFLLWPAVWRKPVFNQQTRFLICWILPILLFFSTISSKSIHYVIPALPGIALLVAAYASADRWRLGVIAICAAALPSIGLLVAPDFAKAYIFAFHPWLAAAHILMCAGLAFIVWHKPARVFIGLSLSSFLLVVVLHAQLGAGFLPRYDLSDLREQLTPYKNERLGSLPNYDGQYGYVLRLTKRIEPVDRELLYQWFVSNPDSIVIMRFKKDPPRLDHTILYTRDFRRKERIKLIENVRVCYPEHVPQFRNFFFYQTQLTEPY